MATRSGCIEQLARGSTSPVDPLKRMPPCLARLPDQRRRPLVRLVSPSEPTSLNSTCGPEQPGGIAMRPRLIMSALFAMTGQQTSELGPELRLLRLELSRIGNNLNQLAHATHYGESVRCGDVLDAIETTKDRTDRLLRSLPLPHRRRFFSQAEAQMEGPVLH